MWLPVQPINWKIDWPLQCEKAKATFSCKRINQYYKENLWLLIGYCLLKVNSTIFVNQDASTCCRRQYQRVVRNQQRFGRDTTCSITGVTKIGLKINSHQSISNFVFFLPYYWCKILTFELQPSFLFHSVKSIQSKGNYLEICNTNVALCYGRT